MLLMIDNYDSFTYNLVQYFGELGEDVRVHRNDEITLADIAAMQPDRIVISPGPCTPAEAGISVATITTFAGKHSAARRLPRPPEHRPGLRRRDRACQATDARQDLADPSCRHRRVSRPAESVHGDALPLAGDRARELPDCLEITAWTDDGEIMGVRHKTLAVEGVQFHPNRC
jgi:anthranilate synthase component 2